MGCIPRALTAGKLCKACKGTGADIERTIKMPVSASGYIRCSACIGNGLDPAEYFDWSKFDAPNNHPKGNGT